MLGLAIPALFTGFAQVAFKSQADGSLITRNGTVIGSRLAAQGFTKPQYFHERPSATSPAYNAAGTTFANLGPTNPQLATNVQKAAQAILKLEGPYNPGHDDPRHPGRRGHHVRLGDRPRHLAGVREAPVRSGSQPSATCRSRPCRS